jgi:uncharacterized protein with ParB-like and HNH nuclease domain
MSSNNLKSLSSIFNDKIFRIPDYQRGYSWGNSQINDFWRDLQNLTNDKSHYTGMLTISIKGNYCFVIDGQQRLTTIVILLKNILDKLEKNNDYISDELQKINAVEKYLYKTTRNSKNPIEVFGYEKDNSSYDFYRTEILEIQNNTQYKKTLYTKKLLEANIFFKEKLQSFNKLELEILFNKVTQQLKFNLYEIDQTDELDEYVIFETMNNRGKPLSTLEILKNRLIYLVTLLDNDANDKEILREKINKSWKTIYEYLGKTDKNSKKISDENFLKSHWLMYWGKNSKGEANPEKSFLLNDFFVVKKVLINKIDKDKYTTVVKILDTLATHYKALRDKITDENKIKTIAKKISESHQELEKIIPDFNNSYIDDSMESKWFVKYYIKDCIKENNWWLLKELEEINVDSQIWLNSQYVSYDTIDNYIHSLEKSIKSYYNTLNPLNNNFSDEANFWLSKINRIVIDEIKYMPVFLSLFNNTNQTKDKDCIVGILKSMESYIFSKKYSKSKNTSQILKDFYSLPCDFNNYKDLESFNEKLNKIVFDSYSDKNKIFNSTQFVNLISELFDKNNEGKYKKGFYDWKGLTYLLYEYELYSQQQKNGVEKILWENIKTESIEHILPQTPKGDWIDVIKSLNGEEQRNKITHSLGNLVLLSSSDNSRLSNKPFKDKKEIFKDGSYSEIEISRSTTWDIEKIQERSLKILKFMKNRWKLDINDEQLNSLSVFPK